MRLTIQRKVFLAMLTLAVAITLLLIALTLWNLEQGFARYSSEMELGKLDIQIGKMEQGYAEHGSWAFLRNNSESWREICRPNRESENRPFLPPRGGPPLRFPGDHPFPPFGGPPPAPPQGHEGGHRLPGDVLGIFPRLTLIDSQGGYIAGNSNTTNATSRPIIVSEKEVGRLLLAPNNNPESGIATAFLSSQMRNLWLSGLAGVLLALVAAWWLSRHFLAPIRDLTAGAHTIAKGNFSARIPLRGQDELAALARDFNQMAARLEQTEAARTRWISDTSHELRTPLSVLRAEIEAMQDGVRPSDSNTLARLHRQVLQLGKLVDDLRQTLNSDAGGFDLQLAPVALLPLLCEAADGFCERYTTAGLKLDCSGLPAAGEGWLIEADSDRMLQVFNNLIENSLRYTERGGRLLLSAGVTSTQLWLHFDDTPPAPPAKAMGRLFERFFRVEQSRSRAHGGSGLGLAICRQIVHAHNGTIAAHPSPLGGLRIRLTLPRFERS